MDTFDDVYDTGIDFDATDLSAPAPVSKSAIRVPTDPDARSRPRSNRPKRDFAILNSTERNHPLDIYCAEIRRFKSLNPKDERRLQIEMSDCSAQLVQILSRFPGAARFILECQTNLSTTPSNQEPGIDDEKVFNDSVVGTQDDPTSWFECDRNEDSADRIEGANIPPGIAGSAVLRNLANQMDDLDRSNKRYGVDHETTHEVRSLLSKSFSRLPLTPLCIDAVIARMETLLAKSDAFHPLGSIPRGDANVLDQESFEQVYAIRIDEFKSIANEAFGLYRRCRRLRNRIAEYHVGLVVYLARQYSTEPQELTDLIQEGNIGLIKAVERFNYRLGFRFSTYATYWIRLAMSRYLARSSRAVRLPYRQNLHIGMVRKKRENFSQIHGRLPTTLELARDTGISESGLRKLETMSQAIASLNSQFGSDESLDLLSILEQQTFNQPVEVVESQNVTGLIEKAIGDLNQREAFVIRQRFGIGIYAEKTLQELGTVLGLTRERVRQIENGALKKIRRWLEPLAV